MLRKCACDTARDLPAYRDRLRPRHKSLGHDVRDSANCDESPDPFTHIAEKVYDLVPGKTRHGDDTVKAFMEKIWPGLAAPFSAAFAGF